MSFWPTIASHGFDVPPGTSTHNRPSTMVGVRFPVVNH
jgi:hypothetical protein